MDFSEDGSFTIEPLPDGGIRYRMPRSVRSQLRESEALLGAALSLIAFATLISVCIVYNTPGATFGMPTPPWLAYSILLCDVPIVFLGLMGIRIGLIGRFGESVVELTSQELRRVDRLWGMIWKRCLPVASIQILELSDLSVSRWRLITWDESGLGIPCLRVVPRFGRVMCLGMNHSGKLLAHLAMQLQKDMSRGDEVVILANRHIEEHSNPAQIPTQPTQCNSKIEYSQTGIKITLQPNAVFKRFLFEKFVFVLHLSCGIILAVVFIRIGRPPEQALAVGGLLSGLGVPALFPDVLAAFRICTFEIVGNTLRLTTRGIISKRQYQWTREQIRRIRVEPFDHDESPLARKGPRQRGSSVWIDPMDGPGVRILSDRKVDEQIWGAAMLREALQVPAA